MDMSKYDPLIMGTRYRDDELFDEDDDEEEGKAKKSRGTTERELRYNVFADECYLIHATEQQANESQVSGYWHGEGGQHVPTIQPENGRVLLFFVCPESQAFLGVAERDVRVPGKVKWLIQIPMVRSNLPDCLRSLAHGKKLAPHLILQAFLKLDGHGGKTDAGEKYKGAIVLKIMRGFYQIPIWVCAWNFVSLLTCFPIDTRFQFTVSLEHDCTQSLCHDVLFTERCRSTGAETG